MDDGPRYSTGKEGECKEKRERPSPPNPPLPRAVREPSFLGLSALPRKRGARRASPSDSPLFRGWPRERGAGGGEGLGRGGRGGPGGSPCYGGAAWMRPL